MKNIFFVVQTGFAIRNVLRTNAFKMLKNRSDVNIVIITGMDQDSHFKKEFSADNVSFEHLHSNQDVSSSEWFFKNLKGAIQAFTHPTDSYEIMLMKAKRDSASKYFLAQLFKPILKLKVTSKIVNWFDLRLFGNKKYDELFEKYNPDLIFY